MKTIFLLRHAKSTGHDTGIPDLERPLAERGEQDAATMATRLLEKDIRPAVMLSSPAVRAVQTAKLVAGGIGYRLKSIRLRKGLYEDDPQSFFEVLAGLNANYGSVMLVGHNPALSEFAGLLCQGFDKSLSTSSVAGFEFEATSWKTLAPGAGKLVLFESVGKSRDRAPEEKIEKESSKALRKTLQKEIEQKISEVLGNHDRKAMKRVRKPIKKSSRKIAGEFVENLGKKRSK